MKCFACLSPLLVVAACSHYALRVPDTGQEKAVFLTLPDPLPVATAKVEAYLRSRGHYESTYRPIDRASEVRVNESWMRDTSLRYYLRHWDQRHRHLGSWRGQWVLREKSPSQTQLRLKIFEVIYAGLPEDADSEPDLDNRLNWFETNPDELRASLELRRFWTSTYTAYRLPQSLSEVRVPSLIFEPLVKEELRKGWVPSSRLRAF